MSYISTASENHAQNQVDSTIDIGGVSDDLPTAVKMSTGLATENHAHYVDSVDKGDKGYIIRSSRETEHSNTNANANDKTDKLSKINNCMKIGQECHTNNNRI